VREQTEAVVKQTTQVVEQENEVANQTKIMTNQNVEIAKQTKAMVIQYQQVAKQNTLAEARNASLGFLTLVTSIFLPFSTVAAAMSIPTETPWHIGGQHQWKFWVSASCFVLVVFLSFASVYLYQDRKGKHKDKIPNLSHVKTV
jgi:Mg2+ and Co2+ transporter CorA